MSKNEKFDFSLIGDECQINKFKELLNKHLGDKGNVMVVLQQTQEIFGYIPELTVKMIAEALKMPASEIYGIITFYSQFTLTPKAKYNIDICLGTACFVLGSQTVLDKILAKLGTEVGKITPDGKWVVTTCRCLGCCGLAPAITINGEVYGKLTENDIDRIIDSYLD